VAQARAVSSDPLLYAEGVGRTASCLSPIYPFCERVLDVISSRRLMPDAGLINHLRTMIGPMMQGRPYHNIEHVEACIAALTRYQQLAEDPMAIEVALWLHDAVYDSTHHDNEAKSAELSDRLLAEFGVDAETTATVHDLIMATRHDREPSTTDGKLIADIDLLILAAPPADFDRYEQQIRQEYQHVPAADFARGRAAVLTRFLQRSSIFYILREHEQQAKLNLQRSVEQLLGH
jgi:predicted metal-dependent HD superfamily phosphohydrolase